MLGRSVQFGVNTEVKGKSDQAIKLASFAFYLNAAIALLSIFIQPDPNARIVSILLLPILVVFGLLKRKLPGIYYRSWFALWTLRRAILFVAVVGGTVSHCSHRLLHLLVPLKRWRYGCPYSGLSCKCQAAIYEEEVPSKVEAV